MKARSVGVSAALLAAALVAFVFVIPARNNLQHLVFFSARRCSTAAQGCALGAQLGGLGAADRALEKHRHTGPVSAFWAGRTFSCDGENASTLAEAAAAQNIAAIGVSVADVQLPLDRLHELAAKSKAPWVLTNGVRRDGPWPWHPHVDVAIAGGQMVRVFALASGRHKPASTSVWLADPIETLRKALDGSPPGRLNVVLVSTDSRTLLDRVAATAGVHVVFDGDEAAPEPYTADEAPGGALLGGVRGEGLGLFRLSFRPSGAFAHWAYDRDAATSLPATRNTTAHWTYMSAVELLTP